MPTYQLRTNVPPLTEHDVCISSETVAVPTEKVLTEAVLTFAATTGYQVGEGISEATSGITGIIYWITSTTLGIVNVSGVFTGGEVITGGTSGTTETPGSVSNLLEKIAEPPTHTPIVATHNLTSSGAGDPKTIHLSEETEWVMVWQPTANITVYNYSTGTLLYPVPTNSYVSFRIDHRMWQLVLTFDAAGTCQVIESKEELP